MQKTTKDLYTKLQLEPVFLSNEFEGAVIRSTPDGPGFYVKFKGEKEFKAEKESDVVAEAIAARVEISEEDYNNF